MPLLLITGVSRGIGNAIAQRYEAEGFTIVGCASSAQSLQNVNTDHPSWHMTQVDVGDKAALKLWAANVIEDNGVPDVLVNNAGKFIPGAIHEEQDSVYEDTLRVNLDSAYYLSKAIIPGMKTRGSGLIINICSTASITAYPNGGTYAISKHAMLGLGRCLREELKPHNVSVVNLLPGPVYTSSWAGVDLPEERFMDVEHIAEIAWQANALAPRTVLEDVVLRPQLGDIN